MTVNDDRLFPITAPTGKTGSTSVHLLLERGHRVRAFVHRQDDRSEALTAGGAEIVAGDLLNFHEVSSAMRGVSGAYFAYPIAPGLLEATVVFAQARVSRNELNLDPAIGRLLTCHRQRRLGHVTTENRQSQRGHMKRVLNPEATLLVIESWTPHWGLHVTERE